MTFSKSLAALLVAVSALAGARSALADDVVRVGEGPFITGGGYFVAEGKGYFKKVGIDVQTKMFIDGAMAVP